jgi:hypothetical protein
MPVSGVVITLTDRPDAASGFADACSDDARITLGDRSDNRWPIALDTPSADESEQLHEWLLALPSVQLTDVVYVAFDDESPSSDPITPRTTEPR